MNEGLTSPKLKYQHVPQHCFVIGSVMAFPPLVSSTDSLGRPKLRQCSQKMLLNRYEPMVAGSRHSKEKNNATNHRSSAQTNHTSNNSAGFCPRALVLFRSRRFLFLLITLSTRTGHVLECDLAGVLVGALLAMGLIEHPLSDRNINARIRLIDPPWNRTPWI